MSVALDISNSTEYIEKVILDLCRWLFNQEARIITCSEHILNRRASPTVGREKFTAIVLPVGCTLGSLQVTENKNPILVQVFEFDNNSGHKSSRDGVLRILLDHVQRRIGGILKLNEEGAQSDFSLPEGYITHKC